MENEGKKWETVKLECAEEEPRDPMSLTINLDKFSHYGWLPPYEKFIVTYQDQEIEITPKEVFEVLKGLFKKDASDGIKKNEEI